MKFSEVNVYEETYIEAPNEDIAIELFKEKLEAGDIDIKHQETTEFEVEQMEDYENAE